MESRTATSSCSQLKDDHAVHSDRSVPSANLGFLTNHEVLGIDALPVPGSLLTNHEVLGIDALPEPGSSVASDLEYSVAKSYSCIPYY